MPAEPAFHGRLPIGGAGAYALIIDLARRLEIPLGRLAPRGNGPVVLCKGRYIYAGSARGPGGMGARIRRHLSKDKVAHWHADHLTNAGHVTLVVALPGGNECQVVAELRRLPGVAVPLAGFGSSDCTSCPAHLLSLPSDFDPGPFFTEGFPGLRPLLLGAGGGLL